MKFKYIFLVLALIFIVGCTNNANNTGNSTAENNKEASSGASYSLKDLVGLKNNLNFKADYKLTSSSKGTDSSVSMTYYMKGENKFRMDTGSNNILSEVFMVNDEYVVCSKANEAWNCIKMAKPESAANEAEKNPDKYNPVYIGERTYAGVKGRCYTLVNVNDKYDIESCYAVETQKGLPLYTKSESKIDNFVSIMEVTRVYDSGAKESDFIYPAEPKELPDLSQMQNQGDACSVCTQLTGESKDACMQNC